MILYSYWQGEELPTTSWNKDRSSVTVHLAGYEDSISFAPAASGKTNVRIERVVGEKPALLVDVSKPVEPLGPGAPLRTATYIP